MTGMRNCALCGRPLRPGDRFDISVWAWSWGAQRHRVTMVVCAAGDDREGCPKTPAVDTERVSS